MYAPVSLRARAGVYAVRATTALACSLLLYELTLLADVAPREARTPRRALHAALPSAWSRPAPAVLAAPGSVSRRQLLFDNTSFRRYLLDLFTVTYRFIDAEVYAGFLMLVNATT
jgi:hypothetical protein